MIAYDVASKSEALRLAAQHAHESERPVFVVAAEHQGDTTYHLLTQADWYARAEARDWPDPADYVLVLWGISPNVPAPFEFRPSGGPHP